jgi:hypothetical protein
MRSKACPSSQAPRVTFAFRTESVTNWLMPLRLHERGFSSLAGRRRSGDAASTARGRPRICLSPALWLHSPIGKGPEGASEAMGPTRDSDHDSSEFVCCVPIVNHYSRSWVPHALELALAYGSVNAEYPAPVPSAHGDDGLCLHPRCTRIPASLPIPRDPPSVPARSYPGPWLHLDVVPSGMQRDSCITILRVTCSQWAAVYDSAPGP